LLLLLYLDCKTNKFHLDISSSASSGSSGSTPVFSQVFIAEEVDEVGNEGSGYTTMVDVQTCLETCQRMPTVVHI
jgi:hypothetical protein